MKIKKLTLNNFMAFENAEINWSDNINIICGENTQDLNEIKITEYKREVLKIYKYLEDSNGENWKLDKEKIKKHRCVILSR